MATAFDPSSVWEYLLKKDRKLADDAPSKTVWLLRPLNNARAARLASVAVEAREAKDPYRNIVETVRISLTGWRKYAGPNGEELAYRVGEDGFTDEALMQQIVPEDLLELRDAVNLGEEVSMAEATKSPRGGP